jgi:hypothetical protein
VPSYIFGGHVEELGSTMLKTVEFKRLSEILLALVDGGTIAHDVNWAPVLETVMRPLECGTPRKVKFQSKPVLKYL